MKITTTLAYVTLVAVASMIGCKSTNNVKQDAPQSTETRVASQNGELRAKAYLQGVGKRIRIAVADGMMTEEEGRARYVAAEERMKIRMAGANKSGDRIDRNEQRKDISDDRMELRKKLGEAVRNGEMTREEAREIWKEE